METNQNPAAGVVVSPVAESAELSPKARVLAAMQSLGLSVVAAFVPFSQSRNKDEKSPSLNWKVTLVRTGLDNGTREILKCDYMAGMAHCPGYRIENRYTRDQVTAWECENGRRGQYMGAFHMVRGMDSNRKPLVPDSADVLYSLVSDAAALDCDGFESWAGEFGYDPDSIKAAAIYHQCLDIGLKLHAAIGDAGLESLKAAMVDY